MKDSKILKTVLTVLSLFFATQLLMAGNTLLPNVKIASVGVSKKVKVSISVLKAPAKITIADEFGSILVTDETEADTYAKLYNLEQLPEGNYKVNVRTGQKEVEQILLIDNESIIVKPSLRREFLLPMVKLDQKKVNVMMLNTRITDVTVKIRDKRGEVIFVDDLGSVVKVERIYDLASLERCCV